MKTKFYLITIVCIVISSFSNAQAPVLLKKLITSGGNSESRYFTPYKGKTIFSATGDSSMYKEEIWITDGTATGTTVLKIIDEHSTNPSYPSGYKLYKDRIYFSARYGYGSISGEKFALWATDGTTLGTVKVQDVVIKNNSEVKPSDFVLYEDKLYFQGLGYDKDPTSDELWVTDGSTAGTKMVKDINVGFRGSFPEYLTAYKDKLYFSADDGIHGNELWVSDGTDTGTKRFQEICPSSGLHSSPNFLTEFKGKLYFAATNSSVGCEMWMTDGTDTGTRLLKDIYKGTGSGIALSPKFIYNDKLYFSATDGINGFELWETDGTESGTSMVKDINALGSSNPYGFLEYKGKFYFQADDGIHGNELWLTDGTNAGTKIFKDLDTNLNEGSNPTSLIIYNNLLYFTASILHMDAPYQDDYRLWVTDGNPDSTHILAPPAANMRWSLCDVWLDLNPLSVCNGSLYFPAAFFDSVGNQPYIITTTPTNIENVKSVFNDFLIYPNPASDIVNIKLDSGIDEFKLLDLTGKELCHITYSNNTNADIQLDLTNYNRGLYIVEIRTGELTTRKKLLISRP